MQGRMCPRTGHVHSRPDYLPISVKSNALPCLSLLPSWVAPLKTATIAHPCRRLLYLPVPYRHTLYFTTAFALSAASLRCQLAAVINDCANGMSCSYRVVSSFLFHSLRRRQHASSIAEFCSMEARFRFADPSSTTPLRTEYTLSSTRFPYSLTQTTSTPRHGQKPGSARPQSFNHTLVRVSTSNVSHALPSIAFIQNMMQARIVTSPRSPCFTLPHQLLAAKLLRLPAVPTRAAPPLPLLSPLISDTLIIS